MSEALAPASPPSACFTAEDADAAYQTWGANCGPGAIAGVLGMTLDEVRPFLGDFERRGYTNPTLMWAILNNLCSEWKSQPGRLKPFVWPRFGLARVQWEGPWTQAGVPMTARYRHTHWVGSCVTYEDTWIFDINCICVGGWVHFSEWHTKVVPWLLKETTPRANGRYHITHSVEIGGKKASSQKSVDSP